MKKAYVYGSEVNILHYMLLDGLQVCKIREVNTGWVLTVPMSLIEIR